MICMRVRHILRRLVSMKRPNSIEHDNATLVSVASVFLDNASIVVVVVVEAAVVIVSDKKVLSRHWNQFLQYLIVQGFMFHVPLKDSFDSEFSFLTFKNLNFTYSITLF